MFGFLNVYKPVGKTSHDVVAILRRVLKIKQIGHTGTLDPFAEGVLPVCIGKATRLIEYLSDTKAYIGTLKLGESTNTYDKDGEIVKTSAKKVEKEDFESVLTCFRGDIEQIPPIFSAIKVNGKKLYEYARRGEEVEIKPRKATIFELKLLNFNSEENTAQIYVLCSKGTYIRSIANDIGENLECYAHLIKLVRVQAGHFKLENSYKLEELDSFDSVKEKLIYPLEYLDYPKYELNSAELEKVSHGNPFLPSKDFKTDNKTIVMTKDSKLIAIGEFQNGKIKSDKVFI